MSRRAHVPSPIARLNGRWLDCSAGSRSQRRAPGSGSVACAPCRCKRGTLWTRFQLVSPWMARNARSIVQCVTGPAVGVTPAPPVRPVPRPSRPIRRGCHIHVVSATWLGHPRLMPPGRPGGGHAPPVTAACPERSSTGRPAPGTGRGTGRPTRGRLSLEAPGQDRAAYQEPALSPAISARYMARMAPENSRC